MQAPENRRHGQHRACAQPGGLLECWRVGEAVRRLVSRCGDYVGGELRVGGYVVVGPEYYKVVVYYGGFD